MRLNCTRILRSPERLPRGFLKPCGVAGDIFQLGFFALLALLRRGEFLTDKKISPTEKSKKRACKPIAYVGYIGEISKQQKSRDIVNVEGVPLLVSVLRRGNRVIGNRYAENTGKTIASLVTEGRNTGFKACRHW